MASHSTNHGFTMRKEAAMGCYRLGFATTLYVLGFWMLLVLGGSFVGLFAALMDLGSSTLGDGAYTLFGLSGDSAFAALDAAVSGFMEQHKALVILSLVSGAVMAWVSDRCGPLAQLIASLGTICLHVMIVGALL